MRRTIYFFLRICFFLLITTSCEKENTSENRAIFSCHIGGEELYPRRDRSPFLIVTKSFEEGGDPFNNLFIIVKNDSKRYKEILINIGTGDQLLEEKRYMLERELDLDQTEVSKFATCYFESSGSSVPTASINSNYITTSEVGGYVDIEEINLDTKFIKGSFEFDAINELGELISITNGKFNFKL